MELEDYGTQSRLEALIDKATARRQQSLDAALAADIKALCKASDANVHSAYSLIFDRLRRPHSQVRLLALLLCGELFQRSRTFRALLAARFPEFLELVVGFRVQAPLPAPAPAAAALRERALELVERWNADHGARYRQVALAHAYMKDTLRMQFPEVDARQAAARAEEDARQARAARMAQERYTNLLAEWPQQAAEWRSLLRQIDEAFRILQEQDRQGEQATGAQAGGDAGDEGWEDVGAGEARVPAAREAEGLSAYAVDVDPAAAPPPCPADAGAAAVDAAPGPSDAVVETLEGLHKLLLSTALPAAQLALRTMARAEVGAPGEAGHAQRERLLRTATDLKERMTAAQQRYAAAQLDLAALAQAQRRRADAELMGALFGPDSDVEGARARAPDARADGGGSMARGSEPEAVNPYTSIRDPAAPRQRPVNLPMRGAAPAAERLRPAAYGPGQAASTLPADVRMALAAKAPVLPAGAYVHVWDSCAPVYASGHALEVSNHWGPVDVHQELPAARLDELFMVPATDRPRQEPPQQQQPAAERQHQRAPPGRSIPRAPASAPAGAGPSAALPAALPLTAGSSDARVRRAAERAYNEAVISQGAAGNEALARALQDGQTPSGRNAGQNKRQASKAPTRERLQKKLLSGRAAAAALQDSAHADNERRREQSANRWENK